MLYSKSENKKYTEMSMEFDKEFYSGNRDDAKLFKYLYLIFYMLACKGNYFPNRFEDYDGYAQYAATKIYTRYIKKEKKGVKIKSVLNYAKGCKSHLKIDYQNENFEQVTKEGDEDVKVFEYAYKNSIRDSYNREEIIFDTNELLQTIPKIAKEVINDTPYKKDKLLCKHLYMSCLLTILSSITLPNSTLEKITTKKITKDLKDNYIIKQYQKNMAESLFLWNLDDSYSDIVTMLVNKIRSNISSEINDIASSNSIPDDVVDSIISSAYDEKSYTNFDEKVYSYDNLR